MKILILQSSIYGFTLENNLFKVTKVLEKKGYEILDGGKATHLQRLIELCKEVDYALFNFWIEDNTEMMSYHMQWSIVAITRMLFEFKKPILVTQIANERKVPSILESVLWEKNDKVFIYQNSADLLSGMKKKFQMKIVID